MKIISTRLYDTLRSLLKQRIQACPLDDIDAYVALLTESNHCAQVTQADWELFEAYVNSGHLRLPASRLKITWHEVENDVPEIGTLVLAIAPGRCGAREMYQAVYDGKHWHSFANLNGCTEEVVIVENTTHWTTLLPWPEKITLQGGLIP